MRIILASITQRKFRLKAGPARELVDEYVQRSSRYTATELATFESEASLLESITRASGRRSPHLIVLDARGKPLDSSSIANHLRRIRDQGAQQVLLAIGPADGWTPAALTRADLVLSLGAITLPHELALVVLAEQVYRAQTVLAGHPYHVGH